ncbi:MAG: hypothetical protein VXX04_06095 [Actinomycetota bacterium]|nr:hypothetical protein [Actinomycetota bacterium]
MSPLFQLQVHLQVPDQSIEHETLRLKLAFLDLRMAQAKADYLKTQPGPYDDTFWRICSDAEENVRRSKIRVGRELLFERDRTSLGKADLGKAYHTVDVEDSEGDYEPSYYGTMVQTESTWVIRSYDVDFGSVGGFRLVSILPGPVMYMTVDALSLDCLTIIRPFKGDAVLVTSGIHAGVTGVVLEICTEDGACVIKVDHESVIYVVPCRHCVRSWKEDSRDPLAHPLTRGQSDPS